MNAKEKERILATLKEIDINDRMSIPELTKRSDLNELRQIFQKIYDRHAQSYRLMRLIPIAFHPATSLEGLCFDILQSIDTAQVEREHNWQTDDLIWEKLANRIQNSRKHPPTDNLTN